MVDKVIPSNRSRTDAKYGSAVVQVLSAVDRLIAADKARWLATSLMFLNDATSLGPLGLPPLLAARTQLRSRPPWTASIGH